MPQAAFDGKAWGVALTRATKAGLANPPSGKLSGLIGDSYVRKQELERRINSFEIKVSECELYIQLLETLESELSGYRPLMPGKPAEPNIPFQGFVDNMLDLCTEQKIFARNALAEAEEFETGDAIAEMFS